MLQASSNPVWCIYAGFCAAQVFSRGGNVLLPVDSSGRLLEVLLVLDQLWLQHK
jgi:predicted metal-dependent RNase